ncbi:argininosuccinate lyase [Robertmurraya kyonggiensis]|uniref:Argininosuccinate lyase n=1 Tax=Robertmurraya kyonggiensis TaxID=1037680 RepID=A0A4U1D2R0_9BACI|nr:argininosuccinate lyase [Robertmurraya kyonggiensis]TKC16354.1 argininosuccinate lyase [Robertmurraya kyonggiensis]
MAGRLGGEPSKVFRKIVLGHELSEIGEAALTPLLYVNVAHVKMLKKQGLIPKDTANKLISVLKQIDKQGLSELKTDEAEDLYFAVEQKLIELLGIKEAGNIHIGRSRNDIYSTIYRMILRERLLEISNNVLKLSMEVLNVAESQKDTVMPGYTHTQHAQPITVGYYFLGVFEVLIRNHQRIKNAWEFVNKSPLGSAALTTTSFKLDRCYTSDILGFDSIVYNAYDAISGRDYVNDVALAINTTVSDISRVVSDLMNWNMFEFSFIEIPDEYAAISSIMPQKKNPAAFEFLRSAASWVLGDTIGVISSPKGISYSDIRDATKYLYSPLWHALEVTNNVVTLFTEILPKIKWNNERMLLATNEGYSTMTDLADYLVQKHKITFRESHHIIASFVRTSLSQSKNANELSAKDLNLIAFQQGFTLDIKQNELDEVLNPYTCINRKNIAGGTSTEQIQIMLSSGYEQLNFERKWHDEKLSKLKQIEDTIYTY